MTNTTAPEGYERIEWPEVRKGDVLMHENGDRLTVRHTDGVWISVPGSQRNRPYWKGSGFLPYRKVESLPKMPGAYLDKDGDYWLLDRSGNWYDWSLLDQPIHKGGSPQNYAPFTRLVPMPTEEDVHVTMHNTIFGRVVVGNTINGATAAVMALLAGEGGGDDA